MKMKTFFQKIKKKKYILFLLLILIIFIGSYFRLYNLNQTPPGLENKEASLGLEALKISEKNHDLSSFFRKENWSNFYSIILAFPLNTPNINIFSLRLVSAVFSILTLIGFSLLLLSLNFSKLSTLLGVFLLSTSFWHLNFSRIVDEAILMPFFIVWFIYLFILGIQKNSFLLFVLSGFFLGLSFYFSLKFCLLFLILFILLLFFIFFKEEFIKKFWKKLIVFVVAFILIIAPLIYFFYQNPEILENKKQILSSINYNKFSDNILLHLNAFYFKGDTNQKHNHAGTPLIPSTWAILFTIGFALTIKEILFCALHRKNKSFLDPLFKISILSQAVFWIMLLPGILIEKNLPDSSKIVGTIPAIIIFILIPFEYILRLRENLQKSPNLKFKPWRWRILNTALSGLILLVSLSGILNTYTYFFVWNNEIKTVETYQKKLVDFGKIIKEQTPAKNKLAIISNKINPNKNHRDNTLKTAEFVGYPESKLFQFQNSSEALENLKKDSQCQNNLYLFFEANKQLIEKFKTICPNFQTEKQKPLNGYYEFWVLKN